MDVPGCTIFDPSGPGIIFDAKLIRRPPQVKQDTLTKGWAALCLCKDKLDKCAQTSFDTRRRHGVHLHYTANDFTLIYGLESSDFKAHGFQKQDEL
jgi:hypothetical protein